MRIADSDKSRRAPEVDLPEEFPSPPSTGTVSLTAIAPDAGVFPTDGEPQQLQRKQHAMLAAADPDAGLDLLDVIQAGLGVVGLADFFPPVASTADTLNSAISLWRGDTLGAGLGAAAMIPGIGLGAGIANVAHHLKRTQIFLSPRAIKDLKKIPKEIEDSLRDWADAVRERGLTEVRKIPGYNDHQIDHGEHKGRRAIRLNHVYRAFYSQRTEGVHIEAVNRHLYYNK